MRAYESRYGSLRPEPISPKYWEIHLARDIMRVTGLTTATDPQVKVCYEAARF